MSEQQHIAVSRPGFAVVRRPFYDGPLELEVLYWVQVAGSRIPHAMTPLGILPCVEAGTDHWCFLKTPDNQFYLPGERVTYDRAGVEKWIGIKNHERNDN